MTIVPAHIDTLRFITRVTRQRPHIIRGTTEGVGRVGHRQVHRTRQANRAQRLSRGRGVALRAHDTLRVKRMCKRWLELPWRTGFTGWDIKDAEQAGG